MSSEAGRTSAVAEVLIHVRTRRMLAALGFAVLTALSATVEIVIPGTPVPVTFQTLVVSLAGALLGPYTGALSQTLYVLAGALGAPVFSGGSAGVGQLMGPTGGYLLAFPLAAAVTGVLTARVPLQASFGNALRLGVAIFLGTLVIFVGGASQLALLTGDPVNAIRVGVLPFLVGDVLKVVAALLITLRLRRKTLALF